MTTPISSQWPVVVSLPLRALDEPAGDRGRAGLRRAALERLDVPEPERLEVRQVEASDRPRDVPERVGAVVAVLGGVGQRAGPDRIQHDHARAAACGYSRSAMMNVLGLLGIVVFFASVIASPPA